MEPPVLIAGAAAALLLLLGGVLLVVLLVLRSRRASARALAESRAETQELRRRLDELTERWERQSRAMVRLDDPAYVITDAGGARDAAAVEATVADRVVLSATVGEPLVKAVALGHGLRRALSAESRNTIWFAMRREVRRSRKQRRREMKQAWRLRQAEDRAGQGTGDAGDPGASVSAA